MVSQITVSKLEDGIENLMFLNMWFFGAVSCNLNVFFNKIVMYFRGHIARLLSIVTRSHST